MRSQLADILVPLDGSEAADRAIPVAARIAARTGARLHFVAICRPLVPATAHIAPGFVVVSPNLESINHATLTNHLDARADDVEMLYHVPVVREVIDGIETVADDLIRYAVLHDIDLIVMRTHGRSAIGRLCVGSVGSALVDRAGVPCVLLRDNHGARERKPGRSWDLFRIIVPLDGSDEAEMGIDQALALATPSVTDIRLVVVVDPRQVPRAGQDYTVPQTVQLANAEAYVNGLARRLEARGYRAKGLIVVDPNPAEAIAACASEQHADLVSIAAHHRGQGNRLLFGSVIDSLVHETDVPILARRLGMAAARVEKLEEVAAACAIARPEAAAV